MAKHKNRHSQSRPVLLTLLGLVSLGLIVALLLKGTDVALFSPKGLIAGEQHRLMIFSGVILLDIAIPSLFLFYYIAWKYRESNEKTAHDPNIRHGKFFVFSIWAVPTFFMLLLSSIMWSATHRLAPQKAITDNTKPLTIQVVAMRWKWLFIYPEQDIATVNFVQVPVNTPVQFVLTADETPMSSFWIPHLGGQLYAMTGHQNQLNLMADTPGDYAGRSAEINGAGFAGMEFTARASSSEDFGLWVQNVRKSSGPLNDAEYQKLLMPSENNKAVFYSDAEQGLYDIILAKYAGSHDHHAGV